jgi:membrane fusion protein, multidrug efflux system
LPYEHDGELTFSGSRLDTSTDMVMLRVRFANPEGLLVPGMFVRAQLTLGQQQLVARLPQQAVSFDEHGQPVAWVIRDNKAEQQVLQLLDSRPQADSRHQWLVQQGLVDGSQVVTEGSMRLYPGATVMSTDWQAPEERLASDSPDHGGQP